MEQQKHLTLYDQDTESVKALNLIAPRVIYSLTPACKGHRFHPSKGKVVLALVKSRHH